MNSRSIERVENEKHENLRPGTAAQGLSFEQKGRKKN
jgi:hypothetical protein